MPRSNSATEYVRRISEDGALDALLKGGETTLVKPTASTSFWLHLYCCAVAFHTGGMTDVTRIISRIDAGDSNATDELFVLVYAELRRLASAKLAHERVDHTLQPTALVHEAYVRLVKGKGPDWNGRNHFFGSAAQAMRRILVEHARKSKRHRAQGSRPEIKLEEFAWVDREEFDNTDILAIDEAISLLQETSPRKAELVSCAISLDAACRKRRRFWELDSPQPRRIGHSPRHGSGATFAASRLIRVN